jgi:hypothetical protein
VKRGDVLLWRKYPFVDRNAEHGLAPSDKLLVVIGTGQNGDILFFRTTSQARTDRPDGDGCHTESSVFRFNANLGGFEKPTWVQFEQFLIHEEREIVNAGARIIFSLASNDIQAIINCFKRSPELCNWLLEYCT